MSASNPAVTLSDDALEGPMLDSSSREGGTASTQSQSFDQPPAISYLAAHLSRSIYSPALSQGQVLSVSLPAHYPSFHPFTSSELQVRCVRLVPSSVAHMSAALFHVSGSSTAFMVWRGTNMTDIRDWVRNFGGQAVPLYVTAPPLADAGTNAPHTQASAPTIFLQARYHAAARSSLVLLKEAFKQLQSSFSTASSTHPPLVSQNPPPDSTDGYCVAEEYTSIMDLWLTGHSAGGAAAQCALLCLLAGGDLVPNLWRGGLVTVGAPLVVHSPEQIPLKASLSGMRHLLQPYPTMRPIRVLHFVNEHDVVIRFLATLVLKATALPFGVYLMFRGDVASSNTTRGSHASPATPASANPGIGAPSSPSPAAALPPTMTSQSSTDADWAGVVRCMRCVSESLMLAAQHINFAAENLSQGLQALIWQHDVALYEDMVAHAALLVESQGVDCLRGHTEMELTQHTISIVDPGKLQQIMNTGRHVVNLLRWPVRAAERASQGATRVVGVLGGIINLAGIGFVAYQNHAIKAKVADMAELLKLQHQQLEEVVRGGSQALEATLQAELKQLREALHTKGVEAVNEVKDELQYGFHQVQQTMTRHVRERRAEAVLHAYLALQQQVQQELLPRMANLTPLPDHALSRLYNTSRDLMTAAAQAQQHLDRGPGSSHGLQGQLLWIQLLQGLACVGTAMWAVQLPSAPQEAPYVVQQLQACWQAAAEQLPLAWQESRSAALQMFPFNWGAVRHVLQLQQCATAVLMHIQNGDQDGPGVHNDAYDVRGGLRLLHRALEHLNSDSVSGFGIEDTTSNLLTAHPLASMSSFSAPPSRSLSFNLSCSTSQSLGTCQSAVSALQPIEIPRAEQLESRFRAVWRSFLLASAAAQGEESACGAYLSRLAGMPVYDTLPSSAAFALEAVAVAGGEQEEDHIIAPLSLLSVNNSAILQVSSCSSTQDQISPGSNQLGQSQSSQIQAGQSQAGLSHSSQIQAGQSQPGPSVTSQRHVAMCWVLAACGVPTLAQRAILCKATGDDPEEGYCALLSQAIETLELAEEDVMAGNAWAASKEDDSVLDSEERFPADDYDTPTATSQTDDVARLEGTIARGVLACVMQIWALHLPLLSKTRLTHADQDVLMQPGQGSDDVGGNPAQTDRLTDCFPLHQPNQAAGTQFSVSAQNQYDADGELTQDCLVVVATQSQMVSELSSQHDMLGAASAAASLLPCLEALLSLDAGTLPAWGVRTLHGVLAICDHTLPNVNETAAVGLCLQRCLMKALQLTQQCLAAAEADWPPPVTVHDSPCSQPLSTPESAEVSESPETTAQSAPAHPANTRAAASGAYEEGGMNNAPSALKKPRQAHAGGQQCARQRQWSSTVTSLVSSFSHGMFHTAANEMQTVGGVGGERGSEAGLGQRQRDPREERGRGRTRLNAGAADGANTTRVEDALERQLMVVAGSETEQGERAEGHTQVSPSHHPPSGHPSSPGALSSPHPEQVVLIRKLVQDLCSAATAAAALPRWIQLMNTKASSAGSSGGFLHVSSLEEADSASNLVAALRTTTQDNHRHILLSALYAMMTAWGMPVASGVQLLVLDGNFLAAADKILTSCACMKCVRAVLSLIRLFSAEIVQSGRLERVKCEKWARVLVKLLEAAWEEVDFEQFGRRRRSFFPFGPISTAHSRVDSRKQPMSRGAAMVSDDGQQALDVHALLVVEELLHLLGQSGATLARSLANHTPVVGLLLAHVSSTWNQLPDSCLAAASLLCTLASSGPIKKQTCRDIVKHCVAIALPDTASMQGKAITHASSSAPTSRRALTLQAPSNMHVWQTVDGQLFRAARVGNKAGSPAVQMQTLPTQYTPPQNLVGPTDKAFSQLDNQNNQKASGLVSSMQVENYVAMPENKFNASIVNRTVTSVQEEGMTIHKVDMQQEQHSILSLYNGALPGVTEQYGHIPSSFPDSQHAQIRQHIAALLMLLSQHGGDDCVVSEGGVTLLASMLISRDVGERRHAIGALLVLLTPPEVRAAKVAAIVGRVGRKTAGLVASGWSRLQPTQQFFLAAGVLATPLLTPVGVLVTLGSTVGLSSWGAWTWWRNTQQRYHDRRRVMREEGIDEALAGLIHGADPWMSSAAAQLLQLLQQLDVGKDAVGVVV